MRQTDILHRFTIEQSPVRGNLVRLDETWQEALRRKEYPLHVRQVLGEAMAAGALLISTLKFDGMLTMQVQGDGILHLLVVEVTSQRTVRALARWHEGEDKGENVLGDGHMVLTLETVKGERYQGVVSVRSGNFNQALEEYFSQSEQLATRLWLAADANVAAGLLLQELPHEQKDEDEDEDGWDRAVALAETISAAELLELPAETLLHRLFHEDGVRLYAGEEMAFQCSCSRERVGGMLKSLGYQEARETLAEQGAITVHCEFCGAHYGFDAVDVEQLFAEGGVDAPGDAHH